MGFSILELIVAVAIFAISFTSITYLLIDINKSAFSTQQRIQAILISEEGIDSIRAIRDADFENSLFVASDGQYTLNFNENDLRWSLEESEEPEEVSTLLGDSSNNKIFYRLIEIEEISGLGASTTATTSKKLIKSIVTYDKINGGIATTTLQTIITNWKSDEFN